MAGGRSASFVAVGLAAGLWSAVWLAACGGGAGTEPRGEPTGAGSSESAGAGPSESAGTGTPELHNEEWRLLKMATAHGNMVIEVEVADPSRALEVARVLREPLGDQYDEVLVYVHRMGEATQMPVGRVRWTRAGGYEEMVYGEARP